MTERSNRDSEKDRGGMSCTPVLGARSAPSSPQTGNASPQMSRVSRGEGQGALMRSSWDASATGNTIEYGYVVGSQPKNPHLHRMNYKSRLGEQSHVSQDTCGITKEPIALATEDISGAVVLPYTMLKTQLGGGIYGGGFRKTTVERRQEGESNKVDDIAGDPVGRSKFDSMHKPGRAWDLSLVERDPPPERAVRDVRTSDPVVPVYQSLDGRGRDLSLPEGCWNTKHILTNRMRERQGVDRIRAGATIDKRTLIHFQEKAQEYRSEVAAVEALS